MGNPPGLRLGDFVIRGGHLCPTPTVQHRHLGAAAARNARRRCVASADHRHPPTEVDALACAHPAEVVDPDVDMGAVLPRNAQRPAPLRTDAEVDDVVTIPQVVQRHRRADRNLEPYLDAEVDDSLDLRVDHIRGEARK